jgi:hypothetical protein
MREQSAPCEPFDSAATQITFSEDQMKDKFICAWTSGFPDRRPVYLYENDRGWGATESRDLATRYTNAVEAIQVYISKHAFPEDYEANIKKGQIRAEAVEQPEIF